jgi:hypothetical protein
MNESEGSLVTNCLSGRDLDRRKTCMSRRNLDYLGECQAGPDREGRAEARQRRAVVVAVMGMPVIGVVVAVIVIGHRSTPKGANTDNILAALSRTCVHRGERGILPIGVRVY